MRDRQQTKAAPGGEVTQKVYRLAFATDPTYAEYFGTANVLAEKVTLINRVNQIYNDDLAIKMVLIDETDDLNLDTEAKATGINGPCGSHPCFDPAGWSDTRVSSTSATWAPSAATGSCSVRSSAPPTTTSATSGSASTAAASPTSASSAGTTRAAVAPASPSPRVTSSRSTTSPTSSATSTPATTPSSRAAVGSNGPTGGRAGLRLDGDGVRRHLRPDDLQPHTDPYFSAATVDEINAYTNNPTLPVVEVQTVSLPASAPGDTLTLGFGSSSR